MTWLEAVAAWSALGTAVFTGLLVLGAFLAWRTAKKTLRASEWASRAAEEANRQAQRDSIERTRPYVHAEVVPGLASTRSYDIKIRKTGQSSARDVTLSFDSWPAEPDKVTAAVQTLFKTPRTIPPGSAIRVFWRLEGTSTDGTTVAGVKSDGRITVSYTSDDPSQPAYSDTYGVWTQNAGMWPVGEDGPNADPLKGTERKFYLLGQALVRRVSELGR